MILGVNTKQTHTYQFSLDTLICCYLNTLFPSLFIRLQTLAEETSQSTTKIRELEEEIAALRERKAALTAGGGTA